MNSKPQFKVPSAAPARPRPMKFSTKFKTLLDLDDTFCNAINLEDLSNSNFSTPDNSPILNRTSPGNSADKNTSWNTPKIIYPSNNLRKRANESQKVSPVNKRIILDMKVPQEDSTSFLKTSALNLSNELSMSFCNERSDNNITPTHSNKANMPPSKLLPALNTITPEKKPAVPSSSFTCSPITPQQVKSSTSKENIPNSAKVLIEDDDDDDFLDCIDDSFLNNSQKFLNDIKLLDKTISKTPIKPFTQHYNITKNAETCSQYIRMNRSMVEVNEENVNDYDEEIHIMQSTQYQREFQTMFDECEQNISNANANKSSVVHDDLSDINDLNWDEEMFNSPHRVASNSVIKNTPSPTFLNKSNNLTVSNRQRKKHSLGPVSTSSFRDMGPFHGLPLIAKKLIKEYKGIDSLYDWQEECLSLDAIPKRENLIYALPTSGGKTLVAEILILREIICRSKNVLFILPFVSIVQEKVAALSPFAVNLNFLVEEYAAGKGMCPPRKRRTKNSVYICTIEKGMALFDSIIENSRANEIGLVVIDELHIIGEQGRGAVLESLLTKIMFLNARIQIVGMSATIGNLNELSAFLKADVYTRDFRPVELKEYIKTGDVMMAINPCGKSNDEIFLPHKTENFGYNDYMNKIDPDHIQGLVLEVVPKHSCLIFCPSKNNCENVAMLLAKTLPKKLLLHRKQEKIELINILNREASGGLCPILSQTIPFGVAYHHSGLTSDERKYLEDSFRIGIINVICCTSTLAAGVNLPAKRVILRSPYVGKDFITLSRYKQMIGRAGRTGMCGENEHGESILICPKKDNIRVHELLCSPMDEANSSLYQFDGHGLRSLILSAIDLGLATTRNKLKHFILRTMLAVQAERLQINVNDLSDKIIKDLFKIRAITLESMNKGSHLLTDISILMAESQIPSASESTQKEIEVLPKGRYKLTPNATLEISKLGKAAIRACIDLTRAKKLYSDLLKAQQSFVLVDYLHLLYIVTPYETADTINLNMSVYYSLYNNLKSEHLTTARVIGITEVCAMKMMSGKSFSSDIMIVLKRFFVTLMLYDLWNGKNVFEVSTTFRVNRGLVQTLMSSAATHASSIFRFCEELEEFWAFRELLEKFSKRLSYCCTTELLPLMDLPAVKIGRARQLYNAGYKTIESIASASVKDIVESIDHMHHRLAKQLISAAKNILFERLETLRDEVAIVLDQIKK